MMRTYEKEIGGALYRVGVYESDQDNVCKDCLFVGDTSGCCKKCPVGDCEFIIEEIESEEDPKDKKEKRADYNRRVAEKLLDICINNDLRMMQLIENINNGEGDYFYEEPSETMKRLEEYEKKISE